MIKINQPTKIENKSFEIIKKEADETKFNKISKNMQNVIVRVIHSTADFEFLDLIKFSEDFYETAVKAIKSGCNILTDIKMVKYGISRKYTEKFGNEVETYIDSKDVLTLAKKENITRAMASMRLYGQWADNGLIVIGNAPTALFEVMDLIDKNKISPKAIVGVPVGFVGAAESKDALDNFGKVPYITSWGRKGGTPVAVAIINAIMKA